MGQAKYTAYITRRNKIEVRTKCHISIDFNFHKLMSMIHVFAIQWCCNALCSVVDEESCSKYVIYAICQFLCV